MSKTKKHKGRIRWGRIIALLILVVAVLYSGIFLIRYRLERLELERGGSNSFIAILGVDSRENLDSTRADVIMLAHIDFPESEIELISLPRDSLVPIACREGLNDKITHAYRYGFLEDGEEGGKTCTINTIKNTFNLEKLDHYVVIDFYSLISLVDELGGITLTPSKSFCEMNSWDEPDAICFEAGTPTYMDGEMALAYARHRSSDSDFYRSQRQQEVLTAMMVKVRELSRVRMTSFARSALSKIDTNISLTEVMTYYFMVIKDDFHWQRITAEGDDYYNSLGTYFYRLDDEWLQEKIKELHSLEVKDHEIEEGENN